MAKNFTLTIGDENEFTVNGTDEEIKKALMVLGEFLLKDDTICAANIRALVEIAHYFRNGGKTFYNEGEKVSEEDLATAKKFFAAAEEYGDPEASDYLAELQENPLISESMLLRAAERNAPTSLYDLQETYQEQAEYWRKKIAAKTSSADDDEILKSDRLRVFDVYKRAFAGDVDAMKICLEFCEEESAYWSKREP